MEGGEVPSSEDLIVTAKSNSTHSPYISRLMMSLVLRRSFMNTITEFVWNHCLSLTMICFFLSGLVFLLKHCIFLPYLLRHPISWISKTNLDQLLPYTLVMNLQNPFAHASHFRPIERDQRRLLFRFFYSDLHLLYLRLGWSLEDCHQA